MAEAVRLSFRLRQLFPRHQGPTGWQTAPTLVADFRFLWRRRRYPKRDLTANEALAAIDRRRPSPLLGGRLRAAAKLWRTASTCQFPGKSDCADYRWSNRPLLWNSCQCWTGSGKTLAFYLPALSRVAAHVESDPQNARW